LDLFIVALLFGAPPVSHAEEKKKPIFMMSSKKDGMPSLQVCYCGGRRRRRRFGRDMVGDEKAETAETA